jgi:hypothetical protein
MYVTSTDVRKRLNYINYREIEGKAWRAVQGNGVWSPVSRSAVRTEQKVQCSLKDDQLFARLVANFLIFCFPFATILFDSLLWCYLTITLSLYNEKRPVPPSYRPWTFSFARKRAKKRKKKKSLSSDIEVISPNSLKSHRDSRWSPVAKLVVASFIYPTLVSFILFFTGIRAEIPFFLSPFGHRTRCEKTTTKGIYIKKRKNKYNRTAIKEPSDDLYDKIKPIV